MMRTIKVEKEFVSGVLKGIKLQETYQVDAKLAPKVGEVREVKRGPYRPSGYIERVLEVA